MGVNADARSGDMAIVVAGNTRLWQENPALNLLKTLRTMELDAGTHCVILGKEVAGSGGMGHVFLVLAGSNVGWLWNYDVMVWYDIE